MRVEKKQGACRGERLKGRKISSVNIIHSFYGMWISIVTVVSLEILLLVGTRVP